MKNITMLMLMVMGVVVLSSCEKSSYEDERNTNTRQMSIDINQSTRVWKGNFVVTSDESALCSIFEGEINEKGDTIWDERPFETQPLSRYMGLNNLGTREVSSYGVWRLVSNTITPTTTNTRAGYGYFTISEYRDTVHSEITNSEVGFAPLYARYYESAVWDNGDTIITFPVTWDVISETPNVDATGKVTDVLATDFCGHRCSYSESGNLTLSNPAAASSFIGAAGCVAKNPNKLRKWVVSYSVEFKEGTWALAIDPETGEVEGNFYSEIHGGDFDGACYAPRSKAWKPCYARDTVDGMEWSTAQSALDFMPYADADNYDNWGYNNITVFGQNSVRLDGFTVKDNAQSRTLTFAHNGMTVCTVSYPF